MDEASSFTLRCVHAPFVRFALKQAVAILGRKHGSDLVVDDGSVSRRHAELCVKAIGVEIRDLGSRNGTYVDGELIQTCLARTGQTIQFGTIAFILESMQSADEETNEPKGSIASESSRLKVCESTLSVAQLRVLRSLLEGLSEKEIGERLHLSRHTVHNHARAIYRAFGAHTRSQLLALYANS